MEEKNWRYSDLMIDMFSPNELISVLEIVDRFKKKYPNDDIIISFEDIVRDEICQMFGGHIEYGLD